jgi:chromosome partitioning protein
MLTLGVVSQKGGSGKTTLALHVSIAALEAGLSVAVIDLDPQRSAELWGEYREHLARRGQTKAGGASKVARRGDEPAIVHGTSTSLDEMLAAARRTGTDLVIIDTPPAVDKSMIYAAAAADIVIVPTRTNILDELAVRETLDYLRRINMLAKTVVVLNEAGGDGKGASSIRKTVEQDFGAILLKARLGEHPELALALRDGKGITELGKSKALSKVKDEIRALYQSLMQFGEGRKSLKRKVPA